MVLDEELIKIVNYTNSNITQFFIILAYRLHETSKISQYDLIPLL